MNPQVSRVATMGRSVRGLSILFIVAGISNTAICQDYQRDRVVASLMEARVQQVQILSDKKKELKSKESERVSRFLTYGMLAATQESFFESKEGHQRVVDIMVSDYQTFLPSLFKIKDEVEAEEGKLEAIDQLIAKRIEETGAYDPEVQAALAKPLPSKNQTPVVSNQPRNEQPQQKPELTQQVKDDAAFINEAKQQIDIVKKALEDARKSTGN